MGWAGLTNGELLNKAQKGFDVFLTNDQNLSSQQNLTKYDIAILVLCPSSNQLQDLKVVLRKALQKVNTLKPGYARFVK